MKEIFEGVVEVYNQKIYINTATGKGFDKVLKEMDRFLTKKAKKLYFAGYDFNDIKQELAIMVLEGIRNFNAGKSVKLSTFLHIHLNNKIATKIKSKNSTTNDAYFLKEKKVDSQYNENHTEFSFGQVQDFLSLSQVDEELYSFENNIPEENRIFFQDISDFERLEFRMCLEKITEKVDFTTRRILELVYFQGYTVKDAAAVVGLTGWAASVRLQKLAKKKNVQLMFERI